MREPVTFFQRVVYSDAFDNFLGGAIAVLSAGLVFWGVCLLIGFALHRGHVAADGSQWRERIGNEKKLSFDTATVHRNDPPFGSWAMNSALNLAAMDIMTSPNPSPLRYETVGIEFVEIRDTDHNTMIDVDARTTKQKQVQAQAPTRQTRSKAGLVVRSSDAATSLLKASSDAFCATQCAHADECYAVVVEDEKTGVGAELPCVDGKTGTWKIYRLDR